MIARFQFLLENLILVAPENSPSPRKIVHDGLTMRVFPPYRGRLDLRALASDSAVPLTDMAPGLAPAEPQPIAANATLNGLPVIPANVLQIDVLSDGFDRSRATEQDPPLEPVFEVANGLLLRLRHLARAHQITLVEQRKTLWRMTYLNDDETEFAQDEALFRSLNSFNRSVSYLGVPPGLWEAATEAPVRYSPSPSWTLLLDANGLYAEVGPAIVLAFSAVETRIDSALESLVKSTGFDEKFWVWVTRRGGKYSLGPSIKEKLGPLLRGVSGVSLADEPALWQKFIQLHKARNTFAHEGVARIDTTVVDSTLTLELVAGAGQIVDWIEAVLPEEERRPPVAEWATVETTIMLMAPAEEASSDGEER